MYNVWYLVIAFASITIIGSILLFCYFRTAKKIEEDYKKAERTFFNTGYEDNNLKQKTREEYNKKRQKYEQYGESCYNTVLYSIISLAVVGLIVTLCFSIFAPLCAKQEYNQYIETYTMVEYVYDEKQDFENIKLTQTILELNTWLTNARADVKAYGNWSKYSVLDLDNLKYISLKGENNEQNLAEININQ